MSSSITMEYADMVLPSETMIQRRIWLEFFPNERPLASLQVSEVLNGLEQIVLNISSYEVALEGIKHVIQECPFIHNREHLNEFAGSIFNLSVYHIYHM